MKTHRDLTPLPLAEAMAALLGGVPDARMITMGEGQWDQILSSAYDDGWILLELDEHERPVRAFKRPPRVREEQKTRSPPNGS